MMRNYSDCQLEIQTDRYTGCSLDIVFFPKILEYSGLLSISVLPWFQAGRTPAELSEKSQNFKEKNTIFDEHPV